MAVDLEAPWWVVMFFVLLMYSAVSWFGMFYNMLYGFGGILRTLISLFGAVVIFTLPAMILNALLPDNWIRKTLIAIGFLTLFVIPFMRDWKENKSRRI